jgi:hypothetical protein
MTIDVTPCTRYTLVMSLLPTQPNLPTYERALSGIVPHVYTRNVLLLHATFETSERGLYTEVELRRLPWAGGGPPQSLQCQVWNGIAGPDVTPLMADGWYFCAAV